MRLATRFRGRRGFTLIELLVVVVIIGILASIALPSFLGAQDKARNASVQSNVHTVNVALGQYAADNNGNYPAPTANLADAGGGGGPGGHGHGSGGSGGTTTGSLGGLETYLPGGVLPKSPWGGAGQTAFIAVTASGGGPGHNGNGHTASSLVDARAIAEQGSTMSAIGTDLGTGSVAATTPANLTDYGAISYSYDAGAQVYVVYGSGKKNKDAIVSGSASNAGQ